MTNELESDIRYFKACIEYMPKGEPIASYVIHKGICERAIQALEKQMPKEPIKQDEDCLECPNCDSFIGYESECKDEHYRVEYCPNCGQAIKWE